MLVTTYMEVPEIYNIFPDYALLVTTNLMMLGLIRLMR